MQETRKKHRQECQCSQQHRITYSTRVRFCSGCAQSASFASLAAASASPDEGDDDDDSSAGVEEGLLPFALALGPQFLVGLGGNLLIFAIFTAGLAAAAAAPSAPAAEAAISSAVAAMGAAPNCCLGGRVEGGAKMH